MVFAEEKIISFLNAKLSDISYFEFPIPIGLLLEEINNQKNVNTRNRLTDPKQIIDVINNHLSDKLEVQQYGQKSTQLQREYIVSKEKCKLSPKDLHYNISKEIYISTGSTPMNSNPIIHRIIKHIKSKKLAIEWGKRTKKKEERFLKKMQQIHHQIA